MTLLVRFALNLAAFLFIAVVLLTALLIFVE